MAITFYEVRQIIKNGTLGSEVIKEYREYRPGFLYNYTHTSHNWVIESDGVATGKEQLLFILEELEAMYDPEERIQ